MIYTTNWIERLNKSFRRTLKMRNALPSSKAAITLMGYVAMEMEEKTYSYPISNFKFDDNFKPKMSIRKSIPDLTDFKSVNEYVF